MHDEETTIDTEPREDAWRDEPEQLPRRPPRRRLTRLTGALLALLLLAGGFIGGVLVEKGQAGASAGGGGLRPAFAARTGGAGAGQGRAPNGLFGGGAGGPGGQATIGQVTLVDGSTLYVTDPQGNTVKVRAARGATVTRVVDSKVRSIHPGATVVVQGVSRKGTILAISIRATPATGGGGVVGQLFSGGGGAQGGGSQGGGSKRGG